MGVWVVGYVGLALVYALCTLALIIAVAKWTGMPVPARYWALMSCLLFFIFLTQHPFPDRATMECPNLAGRPDLRIFGYAETFRAVVARGEGVWGVLKNKTLVSMLMNFVICAGIGLLSAKAGIAFLTTFLAALAISILVEVSQLTGMFGIFPCAYREFSIDDIILNVTGALFGALLVTLFPKMLPRR